MVLSDVILLITSTSRHATKYQNTSHLKGMTKNVLQTRKNQIKHFSSQEHLVSENAKEIGSELHVKR